MRPGDRLSLRGLSLFVGRLGGMNDEEAIGLPDELYEVDCVPPASYAGSDIQVTEARYLCGGRPVSH